jgi:hypothetical protein
MSRAQLEELTVGTLQVAPKARPLLKALWTSFACRGPNSRSMLPAPFTWCQSIAPNSSPSNASFNPDESKLRSLAEFRAKSVPLRVGVETSLVLRLLLQKASER